MTVGTSRKSPEKGTVTLRDNAKDAKRSGVLGKPSKKDFAKKVPQNSRPCWRFGKRGHATAGLRDMAGFFFALSVAESEGTTVVFRARPWPSPQTPRFRLDGGK